MNNKKKIVLITLVLIVVLILIVLYNLNNNNNNIASIKKESDEQVSTNETVVDLTSSNETYLLAEDYTNPTSSEKEKVYQLYGYDNVVFTDQGILVKRVDYAENLEERLYTDIWPDTNLTNSVIKPEFGEINEIEVGQTYLYILIDGATEKDLKNYAKQVKKEYSEEIETEDRSIIYKGRNKNRSKVLISLNESRNIGIIHYDF